MGRTRKRPWLAAVLSLLYPGVGHLYLRQWFRALLWLALVFGASLVLIPADIIPEATSASAILEASQSVPLTATIAILLLRLLSMGDAYVLARRLNASQSRRQQAATRLVGSDSDSDPLSSIEGLQSAGDGADPTQGDVAAPQRCPSCGREIEDPELDFCPWCAEPFDSE
ncbi:DUF7575 domain-containing protein [Halapricum desulfuricans]|uniref:Membrane protein containing Zn-ribbon domain n=1 Tax=Halapricum desulfuricans TaxID=2841257 RepID=A0A897NMZ8_9EURY|nr:zinc ribbon domain-containing protein [Halapricum desulfuricans]QSG14078.1 Membrane protein containing Zn-ribbon domain [Halapricum desulfuricans]